MKNLVNYLDDYLEDDLYECSSRNIKDMKERMKAFKRGSREEEIEAHGKPISYNKTFRERSKYKRKNKHKNSEY